MEELNDKINKISKGRYELRISKNNIYYLYDYDYREITRNKFDISDIMNCLGLAKEYYKLIKGDLKWI